MRIHITTVPPELAAVEIKRHIKTHGGEWIVNAVEDEGYVMARAGTLDGKRLARSLSPCLCGPFNAGWAISVMVDDLRAARAIGYGMKSSQQRGRPRTRTAVVVPRIPYEATGDAARILGELKASRLTSKELSAKLGLTRARIGEVVRKLRAKELVVIADITPGTVITPSEHIYGAAA